MAVSVTLVVMSDVGLIVSDGCGALSICLMGTITGECCLETKGTFS